MEIESLYELFFCVSGTATNPIYVPILKALCGLIGFLVFIYLIKVFIRQLSKKKLFRVVLLIQNVNIN